MSHLRATAARADRREGGRHGRPVARTAPAPAETHIRPQLLRLAVLPPTAVALAACAAVLFTIRSTGARPGLTLWAVLAGAVGVAGTGILIAAVAAERAARSVSDRIGALRQGSARGEADLRALVEALRRGEAPPQRRTRGVPPGDADDFELLAADLARAHDGAVTAVVRAAQLSSQAGSEQKLEVFVNLARRLQSLVHREISILDELENEIEDPDLLKGLFHVDHLATRIRRHAENLAVLGGAVSRRQWSNPVSMTEVLRSAIAEVEQYSRVKLVPPIDGELRGHAVADVIHLLAELVENATVFSAPHTQVLLRVNLVRTGLAVEVEDRGLGLPVDEQARMNQLLADPDQVNVGRLLADGRIGLFVVSQLARRHGIRVRLQGNIYGGVQAVLVVPQVLLGSAPGPAGALPQETSGVALPPDPAASGTPADSTRQDSAPPSRRPDPGGTGRAPANSNRRAPRDPSGSDRASTTTNAQETPGMRRASVSAQRTERPDGAHSFAPPQPQDATGATGSPRVAHVQGATGAGGSPRVAHVQDGVDAGGSSWPVQAQGAGRVPGAAHAQHQSGVGGSLGAAPVQGGVEAGGSFWPGDVQDAAGAGGVPRAGHGQGRTGAGGSLGAAPVPGGVDAGGLSWPVQAQGAGRVPGAAHAQHQSGAGGSLGAAPVQGGVEAGGSSWPGDVQDAGGVPRAGHGQGRTGAAGSPRVARVESATGVGGSPRAAHVQGGVDAGGSAGAVDVQGVTGAYRAAGSGHDSPGPHSAAVSGHEANRHGVHFAGHDVGPHEEPFPAHDAGAYGESFPAHDAGPYGAPLPAYHGGPQNGVLSGYGGTDAHATPGPAPDADSAHRLPVPPQSRDPLGPDSSTPPGVGRPAPLPVRGAHPSRSNPADAAPGIRPAERRLVEENAGQAPTPRAGAVRGTMGKPQLPRRRAQEHIVPQLRGGPVPRQDAEQHIGHDPGLMAAFQRGTGLAEAQQSLEADPFPDVPAPDPSRISAARHGPAETYGTVPGTDHHSARRDGSAPAG